MCVCVRMCMHGYMDVCTGACVCTTVLGFVFALLSKYSIRDKVNVEDEDDNNTSTHLRCKCSSIKYYLLYKGIKGRMMEAMSGDGCGAQLKDSIHPLWLR